jgi:alkyl hydroperoxide reductase subunit AhpC
MSTGTTTTKPKILQKAPEFEAQALVYNDVKTIKLADYRGKYLILVFYPADLTYVCPTEVLEFDKRLENFQKLDAEIVICSNDTIETHKKWVATSRKERGLGKQTRIPLLSDPDKTISKAYDVDLEDEGFATRGLFIIDTKGIIRQITINEPGVGRNVEEVLRLLSASQEHAATGKGCPVNWVPKGDTISLDPEGSKKYFDKFGGGTEE